MKLLILTILFSLVSFSALGQSRYESEDNRPDHRDDRQDDYRRTPQPPQGNDPCRYSSCQPRPRPRPAPQSYTCYVNMIDCYGRTVGRYWGRGPQYNGACQVASNLCSYDLRWYGQYGSRCVRVGR